MKNKDSNQIGWVVSLLAAAVILPTVCLLWFMTTAVRNERLAVRQKLLEICNEGIEGLKADLNKTLTVQKENYRKAIHLAEKPDILLWLNAIKQDADSVVIYDSNSNLIYPIQPVETMAGFSDSVSTAFALEQKGEFEQALKIYQTAADPNQSIGSLFEALTGQIRCLAKSGRLADAMELMHTILRSQDRTIRSKLSPTQVAMLRVKCVELLAEHKDVYSDGGMFTDLGAWYTPWEMYPSETTVWALNKILDIAPKFRGQYNLTNEIAIATTIIQTETLAMTCADFFEAQPNPKDQPGETWFAIPEQPNLFVLRIPADKYAIFFIKTKDNLIASIEHLFKEFSIRGTQLILYDNLNRVVYGQSSSQKTPFVVSDFGAFSNGWKLELYFDHADPFQVAADHQRMVYIWSSVLVIGLMMGLVFLVGREILHQARLNTMKNNFVATVTHELKTPLSSMRLLVDTLLEGNYTNQQQCREYLELISRENHRLSRMIDSFLTFSRMERGKQVFDFASVSPADIASAAVEAVQTKLNANHCGFSVTVSPELPTIYADKDAMVTAVINLLDNACKYSGDNKQIELNVYRDSGQSKNGCVCFAVKDNGIGMTRRQIRRIFDKFYQVDSSLARRAEGCGLGLSIVKYIVDAHKGTVEVESKVGSGSVFIIKIPIVIE